MAIAFDAAANGGTTASTWSHTCSGSDRILFVAVTTLGGSTPTATYNSVSMTSIGSQNTGPNNYKCTLFYLLAPATGSNTVEISGSNDQGCSASYTGVEQSGVPDATNTGSNSASTLSVSTTTVVGNCWIVMAGTSERSSSAAQSAGTATTQRATTGTYDISVTGIYDTNGAITPPGATSLEFTHSGSGGTPGMAAVTASFMEVQPTANVSDTTTTTDNLIGTNVGLIPSDTTTTTDGISYPTWNNGGRTGTTSFSNQTQNTSSFANDSRNSSSWGNQSKS
jgi:hypothetical protein